MIFWNTVLFRTKPAPVKRGKKGNLLKLYHTSPTEIKEITKNGYFDDMLFFSETPYEMSACDTILYSIEIKEESILDISQLFYNHEAEEIKEIIEHMMNVLDIDEDTASDLLDDSISSYDVEIDMEPGEAGWFIQTQQGHIARHLGYMAASGQDEQGDVYIVPMYGKESLLINELI